MEYPKKKVKPKWQKTKTMLSNMDFWKQIWCDTQVWIGSLIEDVKQLKKV